MRLCPQGHENTDDAVRCTVCYQQLDQPELVAILTLSVSTPAGVVSPGSSVAADLGISLSGTDRATIRIAAAGPASAWLPPDQVQRTVTSGPEMTLRYRLDIPDDAIGGGHAVELVATPLSPAGPPESATLHVHVEPPPQALGPADGGWAPLDDRTQVLPRQPQPPDEPEEAWEQAPPRDSPPPRRRSAAPVAIAALALLGMVGALAAWLLRSDPLTPQEAVELDAAQATAELNRIVDEDRPDVNDALEDADYLIQLSSKCPGLSADLYTNSEGAATLGTPDGIRDTPSLTPPDILAFHLGLRQRFGSGTLAATRADLVGSAIRLCPDASVHIYTFLVDDDVFTGSDLESAADFCAAEYPGVPGECAVFDTDARQTIFP